MNSIEPPSEPYYSDSTIELHHGDCLDVLRSLPDASVDAVVTDPPYGLEFMGKEWDGADGFRRSLNPNDAGRDNAFGRTSKTSPEYRTASKAQASRRQEGGISQATAPSFLGGLNPKCLTCDRWQRGSNPCACPEPVWTQERLVRLHTFQEWCEAWSRECLRVLKPGGHMLAFGGTRTSHRLACAIEDAGFEIRDSIAWLYGSGFPKSLDVSKAIDRRPGVVKHAEFARHLIEKREAAYLSCADVSEWVVGTRSGACWNWEHHQFPEAKWWPALRDLLGLDEATWGPIVAEAERQKVGTRTTGIGTGNGSVPIMGDGNRDLTASATDDARTWQGWGTALKPAHEPIVVARKPLAGTVAANVLTHGTGALNVDGCRVEGGARPLISSDRRSGNEVYGDGLQGSRNNGATSLGRWPANVVLDESQAGELDAQSGEMTATGAEYDDLGGASRFFYVAKADASERVRVNGTAHPTVKPLTLMRWLVRLVTPPGGLVLEPFAGSGTTVEACLLEGFQCLAIERDETYLPLVVQRINRRRNPVAAVKATGDDGGLFDLLGEATA